MKTLMFSLLAVTAITASSGCCCLERWWCRPWGCNNSCGCGDTCGGGCDDGGGCGCGGGYAGGGNGGGYANSGYASHPPRRPNNSAGQDAFDDGPPTGQVAYPYYTNRGPRDFLARNPRSIGP